MLRRLCSSIAMVACVAGPALAAERATFILTDGERKSGTVIFHGDQRENLINGYLNLGVENAKDMTFPLDQVAVIDFVGGQPTTSELSQLGTGHMLALRNGAAQHGRLVNLVGGDTLLWENEAGQRQQYAIRDVSRVYLNPPSARNAFGYVVPAAPPRETRAPSATPTDQSPRERSSQGSRRSPGGQADQGTRRNDEDRARDNDPGDRRDEDSRERGVTVRINASREWTDSGLTVSRGDRLVFEASAPLRRLVGRIGSGATFDVTLGPEPVVMRGSGRLMLGVSDDERRGDRGSFSVVISQR